MSEIGAGSQTDRQAERETRWKGRREGKKRREHKRRKEKEKHRVGILDGRPRINVKVEA